jgi:DNA repair protein RecN (Recombination protein N)
VRIVVALLFIIIILRAAVTMLTLLKIQNLALVEDLSWELGAGLVGVTGETGAGKSIIVGALNLILGERADRGLIRTGADTCAVEAVFDLKKTSAVDALLTEAGLDELDSESLIIRRVIGATSNKQFVNGSPVTSQMLKALGEHLVDLHGPHDHQSLNSKERQLEMLDAYAGAESLTEQYRTAHGTWRAVLTEHDDLANAERATEQEMDMLRFQIKDIEGAHLKDGEEEEIESRHRIAANSSRLVELCGQIAERLGEGENGVLNALRDVGRMVHEVEKYDPKLVETFAGFSSAQIELQEMESSMRDYLEEIEIEPAELARLEQRIHTIQSLKRKYGSTVKAILDFKADAETKLARIENRGAELEKLRKLMETTRAEVDKLGKQISAKRKQAAPKLAKDISAHLADLGFQRAVFEVQLHARPDPARDGLEEADFHFAPNPGEPLKPLRLTASSGEMSRVLLAVKSALAKQDGIPLMVFDEIDANVGGNIAEAVGRKMAALAERHQVIAITHMPQLASLARSQFVVTKEFDDKRTRSTLHEVSGKARVEELARMLGGNMESAKKHAQSLLAGTK